MHLRIARPSKALPISERFWTDGVGLSVLWRTPPECTDENPLLMVGVPGAAWHIELVGDLTNVGAAAAPAVSVPVPTPTDEDLLVIYIGEPIDRGLIRRIRAAGGVRVKAANPYWDQWGVTFRDPDGYHFVLSDRRWE